MLLHGSVPQRWFRPCLGCVPTVLHSCVGVCFVVVYRLQSLTIGQPITKGAFLKLDPGNVGVITYPQFRDAVQDVVAAEPQNNNNNADDARASLPTSWTNNGRRGGKAR